MNALLAARPHSTLRGGGCCELERRHLGVQSATLCENERVGAPEGGLRNAKAASGPPPARTDAQSNDYLVDPASNHMLVSKIKPCMSKYMPK